MRLITERTLIREVAKRWLEQYPRGFDGKRDTTYEQLCALDKEQATAEDVTRIIGNSSWTDVPACEECERKSTAVVEIGQEPDYESRTAYICVACLKSAVKLAKEKQ